MTGARLKRLAVRTNLTGLRIPYESDVDAVCVLIKSSFWSLKPEYIDKAMVPKF